MKSSKNILKEPTNKNKEELRKKRQEYARIAREKRAEMSRNGTLKEKKTKLREELEQEARERYIKSVFPKLKDLTSVQLAEALLPQNSRERQYVINQLVGKPTELQKINTDKQSVKTLEEKMRGWAGVKQEIQKIPEPVIVEELPEE